MLPKSVRLVSLCVPNFWKYLNGFTSFTNVLWNFFFCVQIIFEAKNAAHSAKFGVEIPPWSWGRKRRMWTAGVEDEEAASVFSLCLPWLWLDCWLVVMDIASISSGAMLEPQLNPQMSMVPNTLIELSFYLILPAHWCWSSFSLSSSKLSSNRFNFHLLNFKEIILGGVMTSLWGHTTTIHAVGVQ